MLTKFTYTNPITRDPALAMRDHFILREGDRWFMTGTSLPAWAGPSPGVRLLASDDLIHWKHEAWLIDASTLPAGCPYDGRFWAPEIHRAHGRYWLTVNSGHEGPAHGDRRMDDHNIFLFAADAITGPYSFVAGPLSTGFKNDASLFTDDDGRSYLYGSGGGLWQAPIDLARGRLLGDLSPLARPGDDGLPEWMRLGIEGPFVIKRDGAYWMFFTAWTRGYEIGVFRAPTPLGPWELTPREPIFGTRKRRYRDQQLKDAGLADIVFTDTSDPFLETGHCGIFEGPDDRDWLCCHYIIDDGAPFGESTSLPQLGIEPLTFADGHFRVQGPTWTEQRISPPA